MTAPKSMLTVIAVVFLTACSSTNSATQTSQKSYALPAGWFKAGSDPGKYEMGIDSGSGYKKGNAATIVSNTGSISGFGTLMQGFAPGSYSGKRVRMTGYMKSKDVKDWAGFWLRIDGKDKGNELGFDNMNNRPVKGTTDWKQYSIVLDVDTTAVNIAYGVLLAGTGQVWFDDVNFEIVGDDVPETNMRLNGPANTSFE
jgi:hypothetical protein